MTLALTTRSTKYFSSNSVVLCPYEEVTPSGIAWFLGIPRKFRCVIGCDPRWRIDMAGPQKDKYGGVEKNISPF